MSQGKMSLDEAAVSLQTFLRQHLPKDSSVEASAEALEDMVQTAQNLVSAASEQGVNTEIPRQAYEAVGWLSVQLESWLFDSPWHDNLFEQWAASVGVQ